MASLTVEEILRLSDCSACKSDSLKERGVEENSSRTPHNSPPSRTGRTTMDRIPRSRQATALTRGSTRVSSQSCISRVCTHAPASPDRVFKLTPTVGALSPKEARHTILSPRASAITAPPAAVARRACWRISRSRTSRARSAGKSPLLGKATTSPDSIQVSAGSGSIHSGPVTWVPTIDG